MIRHAINRLNITNFFVVRLINMFTYFRVQNSIHQKAFPVIQFKYSLNIDYTLLHAYHFRRTWELGKYVKGQISIGFCSSVFYKKV